MAGSCRFFSLQGRWVFADGTSEQLGATGSTQPLDALFFLAAVAALFTPTLLLFQQKTAKWSHSARRPAFELEMRSGKDYKEGSILEVSGTIALKIKPKEQTP